MLSDKGSLELRRPSPITSVSKVVRLRLNPDREALRDRVWFGGCRADTTLCPPWHRGIPVQAYAVLPPIPQCDMQTLLNVKLSTLRDLSTL
jgi:hypothetical protein